MVHRAAIKAIAWCPTRRDFLASGAGTADRRVRIWNTITGASVASCSTGAQVTGLTWAPDGTSELVASLGFSTTAPQPPHGGFCALVLADKMARRDEGDDPPKEVIGLFAVLAFFGFATATQSLFAAGILGVPQLPDFFGSGDLPDDLGL